MCQLTLINVNKDINKLMLYTQLLANSAVSHQDGFGFYQKDSTLYKCKTKPADVANLSDIINDGILNVNPIIGHVRLVFNKTSVLDENAHPFETDKLVLAHNGTLTPKLNAIDKNKYNKEIDSEIFLKELSEVYTGDNFVKAFNNTMAKFTGPFAFLIYSKIEDKYFVIRGKTKQLYAARLFLGKEKVGFIVNTELPTLLVGLNKIHVITKLAGMPILTYEEPVLIVENTISVVKNSQIKYTATTTENEPEKAITVWNYTKKRYEPTDYVYSKTVENKAEIKVSIKPLLDFAIHNALSMEEIDLLMYKTIGVPISYCTDNDFLDFNKYILPKLNGFATKEKTHIWESILDGLRNPYPLDIYLKYGIRFPYMLEKTTILSGIDNDICAAEIKRKHEESSKIDLTKEDIYGGD